MTIIGNKMNSKQSKRLRRMVKKQSANIIDKFVDDIKKLKFIMRFKIAWKIIVRDK